MKRCFDFSIIGGKNYISKVFKVLNIKSATRKTGTPISPQKFHFELFDICSKNESYKFSMQESEFTNLSPHTEMKCFIWRKNEAEKLPVSWINPKGIIIEQLG